MLRRDALAAIGATLTAGCAGLTESADGGGTLTPAPVPPPADRDVPTRADSGFAAACADVGSGQSDATDSAARPAPERYDELPCLSLPWADRTVCHHTTSPSDAEVLLVGGGLAVSDPGAGETDGFVNFVVHNDSDRTATLYPDAWSVLRRLPDDDWRTVNDRTPDCRRLLRPGDAHRWIVGVERAPSSPSSVDVTLGRTTVGPGTYLFLTGVSLSQGATLALAAPFTVRSSDDRPTAG